MDRERNYLMSSGMAVGEDYVIQVTIVLIFHSFIYSWCEPSGWFIWGVAPFSPALFTTRFQRLLCPDPRTVRFTILIFLCPSFSGSSFFLNQFVAFAIVAYIIYTYAYIAMHIPPFINMRTVRVWGVICAHTCATTVCVTFPPRVHPQISGHGRSV